MSETAIGNSGTSSNQTGTGTQADGRSQPGSVQPNNRPSKVAGGVSSPSPEGGANTPNASEAKQKSDQAAADLANTKLKLKIYGKERELDFNNMDDRREIQRRLQMDVAAEQRLQQANEIERKYKQIAELGQKDYKKLMESFGHNPLEVAKAIVAEQIKQEMMDPREREKNQILSERDQIKKQLEERMNAEKSQYEKALITQKQQKWESDIMGALKSTPDLPVAPVTVRLMAQNLLDAKQNGYDMTPQEAAHATKTQMVEIIGDVLGQMTPAQIVKNFGQEFVDKIKNHAIEELRAPLNNSFKTKPSAQPVYSEKTERKWKDWNEVRDIWDKRSKT